MKYVCPTPKVLELEFAPFSRLYAYPATPTMPRDEQIVILDSGAYALSQRGKTITFAHMQRLNEHYKEHKDSQSFCVAPDVFLDSKLTMRNFDTWIKLGYSQNISPVIQADKNKFMCPVTVSLQCQFYSQFKPFSAVFISNPSLTGAEAKANNFRFAIDYVREKLEPKWIHILGAGWNAQDVQNWASIGGFDSMDSVAIYTAAKQGESWDGLEYSDWKSRAAANAAFANKIVSCV